MNDLVKGKVTANKKTKYTVIKCDNKERKGVFDTNKHVVLIELRPKEGRKWFDQNDIDTFLMKLGIDPGKYDWAFAGADNEGFSSTPDYDMSVFYIEGNNSMRMSFIIHTEKGRTKLNDALSYLASL